MFSSPCCLPLRLSLYIWGVEGRRSCWIFPSSMCRMRLRLPCIFFFCRWRSIFFFFRFSIFLRESRVVIVALRGSRREAATGWATIESGPRAPCVAPRLSLPFPPSPPPPLLPSSVKNTATSPTRSCAGGCTSPPVCCIFYFFPPFARATRRIVRGERLLWSASICVYICICARVCVCGYPPLSLALCLSLFLNDLFSSKSSGITSSVRSAFGLWNVNIVAANNSSQVEPETANKTCTQKATCSM